MAITLTEAAADRVSRFLDNRGKGIGIRLAVRTSGCSGMAYVLEFADEAEPDDLVFEDRGVKVLIDPKSLVYLDGTEVDFGKEGLNEGFKFNNPNVKSECGCGESFNVLPRRRLVASAAGRQLDRHHRTPNPNRNPRGCWISPKTTLSCLASRSASCWTAASWRAASESSSG